MRLLLLSLWTLWATPLRVVHKSTASAFGFAQPVPATVDRAKHDRTKADGPAGIVLGETDRLADQRLADVDCGGIPPDLAVVSNPPDDVVGSVVWFAQHAIEAPRRGRVMLGRGGVAERLVRALFVVEMLEGAQTLELFSQVARRRTGGLLQQCQMHALMAAVLLRLGGGDAFRHHTGLDQLDRQLRQSSYPARGKRRPIVRTQKMRQAELAERSVEHRPHMIGVAAA